MNKYFLLILLTCIFFKIVSQSQLKLTKEKNGYSVDCEVIKQQVGYRDPGSIGRNQIWNFQNLQLINDEYSLQNVISYSINNVINSSGIEHQTHYYYQQKNDSLFKTGYENATTYLKYKTPELLLRFPFTYGDTLFSNFDGNGEYSHRIAFKIVGYTKVSIDAEGQLLLPNNKKFRSLRVHTLKNFTEIGKENVQITLDNYAWYIEGNRYPIFESVKTNILRNNKDTIIFTTSFYYPTINSEEQETDNNALEQSLLKTELNKFITDFSCYPNPIEDNFNIQYSLANSANVLFFIQDNMGKTYSIDSKKYLSEGNHQMSFNTNNLTSGVYILSVEIDNNVMTITKIIKK